MSRSVFRGHPDLRRHRRKSMGTVPSKSPSESVGERRKGAAVLFEGQRQTSDSVSASPAPPLGPLPGVPDSLSPVSDDFLEYLCSWKAK